jgi:REP element-mobilizing transposase RayT
MARQLRIEHPGAIYHVTCRMVGDWRTEETLLFGDDADRERFLDRLGERVEQFHIRLYLFVLMSNHFHLVFETPEANCSKFMQSLSTAYTVYYNLRHGRHGHLLDGRFKAKLVDGDDYLLALSRYVHLNPVQVGSMKAKPIAERIAALRGWRWSSYPSYIGKRKALDFIEYGPLLAEMSGKRREWPERYRAFVESGLAESDDEFKVALKESPRSIGGDGFRAWIDDLYQKRVEAHGRPEDVSFRHITEPLSSDEVLAVLADIFEVDVSEFCRRRHDSALRGVAARCLIRFAGQNQREAAVTLAVGTGSAVCNQLKVLTGKLEEDERLQRLLQQAETTLEKLKAQRTAGHR